MSLDQAEKLARMAELYGKVPEFFDSLCQDRLEEEPVLSYITELETRREIFQEFQRLARAYEHGTPSLDAVALGIVMVAPVTELQSRLEEIRNAGAVPGAAMARGILSLLCGELAISGIRAC
jgi:hypothetical protein